MAGNAGLCSRCRMAWRAQCRQPPGRTSLGAVAWIVALVQPRRSRAAVRITHHGDRRTRHLVREPVSRRASASRPLLCFAVRIHGGDAWRRAQRQRAHIVRLLGTDWLHILPADRLRTQATRRPRRRSTGLDRDRRRRARAARCRGAALRCVCDDEPVCDGSQPSVDRRPRLLPGHRRAWCCWPPSQSRRRCRFISGCPAPWRRRRQSAPIFTPRRW